MPDDLDALLAEEPAAPVAAGSDAEADDYEPDEFAMHAETFLDDTEDMETRIEALRSCIMAAKGPSLDL